MPTLKEHIEAKCKVEENDLRAIALYFFTAGISFTVVQPVGTIIGFNGSIVRRGAEHAMQDLSSIPKELFDEIFEEIKQMILSGESFS